MSLKIRARSRWLKKDRTGSLEDNATALAYTLWQISLTAAKNLHAEDYAYTSLQQRMDVIIEYLIFLVHVADRRAFDIMDTEQRQQFVTALAQQTARHVQSNTEDISGSGDYRGGYINNLNRRHAVYSETQYHDDVPGYEMLRTLGEKIQDVMGMDQTNKWVIQQVMDVDAAEALRHLRASMDGLFGTSNVSLVGHGEHTVIGED